MKLGDMVNNDKLSGDRGRSRRTSSQASTQPQYRILPCEELGRHAIHSAAYRGVSSRNPLENSMMGPSTGRALATSPRHVALDLKNVPGSMKLSIPCQDKQITRPACEGEPIPTHWENEIMLGPIRISDIPLQALWRISLKIALQHPASSNRICSCPFHSSVGIDCFYHRTRIGCCISPPAICMLGRQIRGHYCRC
jgi:hypothetical protein